MMRQENHLTPRNALQPGYKLLWYKIRSVLGQGAFGITYLAQDINLNRLVAIKEFMPGQYAMREGHETVRPISEDFQEKFSWGLRSFIDEARVLDQFDHPNIVRVMNIFEANNTAYMVMRYEQGVNLKEILLRQKFLDQTDLLNILFPILDGLKNIHAAGFIHRDLKPANIFIRTDGTPVLLDFGSARQSLEKDTHTLTSLVSPGYAPIEQYVSKSDKQGPWSDIYGVAATLYRAITGIPPIDAVTRGESLTGNEQDSLISCRDLADKRYSDHFITAIEHGLAFLTRDRPQSIDEWKDEFLPLINSSTAATSGHASSQMLSLVKESLTQTVTRIHDNPDLPDYWDKEESTSVEMAHKRGFRHGLKVSLVLLSLIIAGFFIGNSQKIQQLISSEELISNEPLDSKVMTTTESAVIAPVVQTEITVPDIVPGSAPPMLDEETAARLQAEGKIIIVGEAPQNKPTNVTIKQSAPLEVLTGDDLLFKEFPGTSVSEQDIILEHEMVVELPITDPQGQREQSPAVQRETIPSVGNNSKVTETNNVTIQEVYIPARNKVIEIAEVHVPLDKKKEVDNVVVRIKNWVNSIVNSGQPPVQKQDVKDQP